MTIDKNIPYIIAVDFDGTLVEDKYPNIGQKNISVWDDIRAKKALDPNTRFILWTCRNGEALKEAVEFCSDNELHFDAINENIDEVKVLYGGDTRKVFADEYWDDKAVRV